AHAGLERLDLAKDNSENSIELDWMIPAPAQGAMLVVAKEEDAHFRKIVAALNHEASEVCTHIERQFLKTLEGGCSEPIGALAKIEGETIHFKGGLFSLDGTQKFIEEI